ncbi:UbiA prenyltransferase family protein [Nocardia sp. SSK8]|uniref:UbiA prenyltransferase family protein n=1 Tax=Nocardia sp. SSK8 TaxID=3120154 RepID=UPI00300A772C
MFLTVPSSPIAAPIGLRILPPAALRLPGIAHAVLREARPVVLGMFLLRLVVGVAQGTGITTASALVLTGWMALVTAVYLMNGLSDLTGDIANGSRRPLAAGELSVETARTAVGVLTVAGLLCCAAAGVTQFLLAVVFSALGAGYSYGPKFKERTSSASFAAGAGIALTYLAMWSVDPHSLTIVLVDIAVAGWVSLCCAVKDFSDVHGDRLAGRRTWPVRFGERRAAQLISALSISFAAALCALGVFVAAVLPVAAVLLVGALVVAVRALTGTDPRAPYRAFMVTQLAANACLFGVAVTLG